jgi:hypothetical protein
MYQETLKLQQRQSEAAIIIQQFIRWRNSTFHHAASRLLKRLRDRRKYAYSTLQIVFTYHLRGYIRRWKQRKLELAVATRLEEARIKKVAMEALYLKSLRVLRKFFARVWEQKHAKKVKRALQLRRSAHSQYSHMGTVLHLAALKDAGMMYTIPGVRQNSVQFQRALMQRVVCCDGSDSAAFTPFDVVMLSQVSSLRVSTGSTLIVDCVHCV